MGRNRARQKAVVFSTVALYARAWVEMSSDKTAVRFSVVALYARAWVEIFYVCFFCLLSLCRPLREGVGRNITPKVDQVLVFVALYARAWVEIMYQNNNIILIAVALYARAWVEIVCD